MFANSSKCEDIWDQIEDNVKDLNWYDLYRKNYDIKPNATHDFWGNPLENSKYGKSVLKNGQETTYKRGFSFYDYVGKWNKHHPAIWA